MRALAALRSALYRFASKTMTNGTQQLRWWQTRQFVVLAALASMLPLLTPAIPPMVDLPGHMGRYRVQMAYNDYPWLADW